MLEFYQKRSWRIVLRSWWFVGFLVFLCLFLLFVVYNRYTIERDMAARRLEAETALIELQHREALIADKVKYLESERGIEAEMRRNFDVAQPGEQVVIILDPAEESATISPLPPPALDTPPWYIFWR
jgi:cell division protein FtsB